MKKIGGVTPVLSIIIVLLLPHLAISQSANVNTNSDNTNINQFVMPGGSGFGGTTTNAGSASRIPRTWFNPMVLPGVSGPIYYGGPVRFGKELLDVGILIRFKPIWDAGFADRFANNRPGKINVSESVPVPKDAPSVTAVIMTVTQPRSIKKLREFNRSYELVDCYSIDGTDGADSAKLLGKAAEKANKIGAEIGIIVNQGANFELYGKDSQQVIGFSPTLMGGGGGSVAGGALGFAFGWAQHRAKYLTQPFLTVLLFKSTGVPYNWFEPIEKKPNDKKASSAAPRSPYNNNNNDKKEKLKEPNGRAKGEKGAKDAPQPKGEKLPYERPDPSVLLQPK